VDNSVEKIATDTTVSAAHIILNFNQLLSPINNIYYKQPLEALIQKSIDLYQ